MERHHAGFVKGFMNGARDVMGEERTNSSWLHPRKLPVPRARFGGAITGSFLLLNSPSLVGLGFDRRRNPLETVTDVLPHGFLGHLLIGL